MSLAEQIANGRLYLNKKKVTSVNKDIKQQQSINQNTQQSENIQVINSETQKNPFSWDVAPNDEQVQYYGLTVKDQDIFSTEFMSSQINLQNNKSILEIQDLQIIDHTYHTQNDALEEQFTNKFLKNQKSTDCRNIQQNKQSGQIIVNEHKYKYAGQGDSDVPNGQGCYEVIDEDNGQTLEIYTGNFVRGYPFGLCNYENIGNFKLSGHYEGFQPHGVCIVTLNNNLIVIGCVNFKYEMVGRMKICYKTLLIADFFGRIALKQEVFGRHGTSFLFTGQKVQEINDRAKRKCVSGLVQRGYFMNGMWLPNQKGDVKGGQQWKAMDCYGNSQTGIYPYYWQAELQSPKLFSVLGASDCK